MSYPAAAVDPGFHVGQVGIALGRSQQFFGQSFLQLGLTSMSDFLFEQGKVLCRLSHVAPPPFQLVAFRQQASR